MLNKVLLMPFLLPRAHAKVGFLRKKSRFHKRTTSLPGLSYGQLQADAFRPLKRYGAKLSQGTINNQVLLSAFLNASRTSGGRESRTCKAPEAAYRSFQSNQQPTRLSVSPRHFYRVNNNCDTSAIWQGQLSWALLGAWRAACTRGKFPLTPPLLQQWLATCECVSKNDTRGLDSECGGGGLCVIASGHMAAFGLLV